MLWGRADPVLVNRGEWVVEIDRPKRSRGRHRAKSDAQDAIRAGIVQAGADARRQLKALIVTAPEPLQDSLRGRPWRRQVGACAELVAMPSDPVEHRATVPALHLTAQRVLAARQDAKQLEAELRQLVMVMARPCSASPASALRTVARQLYRLWERTATSRGFSCDTREPVTVGGWVIVASARPDPDSGKPGSPHRTAEHGGRSREVTNARH